MQVSGYCKLPVTIRTLHFWLYAVPISGGTNFWLYANFWRYQTGPVQLRVFRGYFTVYLRVLWSHCNPLSPHCRAQVKKFDSEALLQRQPVEGEPESWGDDADMEGQRDAGGDVSA